MNEPLVSLTVLGQEYNILSKGRTEEDARKAPIEYFMQKELNIKVARKL